MHASRALYGRRLSKPHVRELEGDCAGGHRLQWRRHLLLTLGRDTQQSAQRGKQLGEHAHATHSAHRILCFGARAPLVSGSHTAAQGPTKLGGCWHCTALDVTTQDRGTYEITAMPLQSSLTTSWSITLTTSWDTPSQ
jgi:hypothetical protein